MTQTFNLTPSIHGNNYSVSGVCDGNDFEVTITRVDALGRSESSSEFLLTLSQNGRVLSKLNLDSFSLEPTIIEGDKQILLKGIVSFCKVVHNHSLYYNPSK